ncbi:hypothetical protein [Neorhizobium galegae]|uniref:hypothetical protein n=1 Tax=Neorhizobium galegae TaxID=399 RepID=UPI0021074EC3|nr:hypothetical protein [Neorhizobium galegae]MCQ1850391.1 hypothetical protein [Neorhizobium galegae]
MVDAVSADPLFGLSTKFGAQFDRLVRLLPIAQTLLSDAAKDPADTTSAHLAEGILASAVALSRQAESSFVDLGFEFGRRLDGIMSRTEQISDRVIERLNQNPVFNSAMNVARKAIEADTWATAERYSKEALHEAYAAFKERQGVSEVERDSQEWRAMMAATKPEYESLQRAKRDARNAQRRLATAIRNHRHGFPPVEAEAE